MANMNSKANTCEDETEQERIFCYWLLQQMTSSRCEPVDCKDFSAKNN